jgi:class 3 adenylate cyclase
VSIKEPELTADAAHRLADHLRHGADADTLASSLQLPTDLVKGVLQGLERSREESARRRRTPNPLAGLWRAWKSFFGVLTRNPLLFIAATTLIACGLLPLVGLSMFESRAHGANGISFTVSPLGVYLIPSLLALHLLCYYAHARSRLPLYGSLVAWLVTAPIAMGVLWRLLVERKEESLGLTLLGIALAIMFLWAIFAPLGMMAAVIGGLVRMKRAERLDANLSRQELLERLFALQEMLRAAEEKGNDQALDKLETWKARFREHPVVAAVLVGAFTNLAKVLLVSATIGLSEQRAFMPLMITVGLFTFALQLVGFVLIGFFSRSIVEGVLLCMLAMAAAYPVELIPLGPFGPAEVREALLSPWMYLLNFGYAGFAGLFGALGGVIQERATRELRLKQSDPAALFSEMVRIQVRLAPATNEVTVMVVDAAKSAEMKASADPLRVEYSFREYQNWLARIAGELGGSVHSTAGDGAVLSFKSASDAFESARRIQSGIAEFNQRTNRLSMPFRLRVGLHRGTVAGDLDKVQFTDVIDIAAHVQGKAPIGGIAATEAVAKELPWENFAELAEKVDGCTVYLSLNPSG